MPTVEFAQHIPQQHLATLAKTCLSLRCFPFSFPCFWKLSRSCSRILNSFINACEIFPCFLSLNCFFEYTCSLPEMWEVAASGVRKGLFAVLVALHSDLAKWFPLSDADGAHCQLCSRSALTQHCSTHTNLKALTPALSCCPSGDRGNQAVGQTPAQEGETLAKLPNSELQPTIHSSLRFSGSWYRSFCAVLSFLLLSPPLAILYYTTLHFLIRFHCSF